ncbi:hypothetical protein HK098_005716 [Nowakowskiella sp. JEL0407]|nr:hypothetical protein HK098_005716 [Nowakowskiella sp. JEL0407]
MEVIELALRTENTNVEFGGLVSHLSKDFLQSEPTSLELMNIDYDDKELHSTLSPRNTERLRSESTNSDSVREDREIPTLSSNMSRSTTPPRSRGRPPKKKKPEAQEPSISSETPKIKRGRGRPRKTTGDGESDKQLIEANSPGKQILRLEYEDPETRVNNPAGRNPIILRFSKLNNSRNSTESNNGEWQLEDPTENQLSISQPTDEELDGKWKYTNAAERNNPRTFSNSDLILQKNESISSPTTNGNKMSQSEMMVSDDSDSEISSISTSSTCSISPVRTQINSSPENLKPSNDHKVADLDDDVRMDNYQYYHRSSRRRKSKTVLEPLYGGYDFDGEEFDDSNDEVRKKKVVSRPRLKLSVNPPVSNGMKSLDHEKKDEKIKNSRNTTSTNNRISATDKATKPKKNLQRESGSASKKRIPSASPEKKINSNDSSNAHRATILKLKLSPPNSEKDAETHHMNKRKESTLEEMTELNSEKAAETDIEEFMNGEMQILDDAISKTPDSAPSVMYTTAQSEQGETGDDPVAMIHTKRGRGRPPSSTKVNGISPSATRVNGTGRARTKSDTIKSDSSHKSVNEGTEKRTINGTDERSEKKKRKTQNSNVENTGTNESARRSLNGRQNAVIQIDEAKLRRQSEADVPTNLVNPFQSKSTSKKRNWLHIDSKPTKPSETGENHDRMSSSEDETVQTNDSQLLDLDLDEIRNGVSTLTEFIFTGSLKKRKALETQLETLQSKKMKVVVTTPKKSGKGKKTLSTENESDLESVPEKTTKELLREEELKNAANDDFCSACLGKGKLLCCDSCPRTFHFTCVEEGFAVDEVPEGVWECKDCRSKHRNAQSRNSKSKLRKSNGAKAGLFDELLQNFDAYNPRVFELTPEIKGTLKHKISHPATGACIDLSEVDVIGLSSAYNTRQAKSRMNQEQQSSTPYFVESNSKGLVTLTKPIQLGKLNPFNYRRGGSNQGFPNPQYQLVRNPTNCKSSSSDISNSELSTTTITTGTYPFCYHCRLTGLRPSAHSFLNSSVVAQPTFRKYRDSTNVTLSIPAMRSEMIQCDFCDLYWHLDCLGDPLASIPSELKDAFEVVDVNAVRKLRASVWGEESVNDISWDYGRPEEPVVRRKGKAPQKTVAVEEEKAPNLDSRSDEEPTLHNDSDIEVTGGPNFNAVELRVEQPESEEEQPSTSNVMIELTTTELKESNSNGSKSSVPAVIQIRKKWKCPCHANETASELAEEDTIRNFFERVHVLNQRYRAKQKTWKKAIAASGLLELCNAAAVQLIWHAPKIDQLYMKNFATPVNTEFSALPVVSRIFDFVESHENGLELAEKTIGGELHATNNELDEWLESVALLQRDIAHHIQMRRGVNAITKNVEANIRNGLENEASASAEIADS